MVGVLFRLPQSARGQAFRLVSHKELASTNDEAMSQARAGDPGQLWVIAETQTKGRGRNGRSWSSLPGNLHASLLLIDPVAPSKAAELGFVAGIATARAVREILGGDKRVVIKWPNDIVYQRAKLSGILLESAFLANGRFACVAGIGVNCGAHPKDVLCEASDLSAITGRCIPPEDMFAKLSAQMAHWLGVWASGRGFESIRAEWLSLAAGVGRRMRVVRPSQTVEGTFRTIDATGRLILDAGAHEVAIEAGDIFFSPWPETPSAAHG